MAERFDFGHERVLFGDNQFFGINHMSEEKARAQALRFQRIDAVIDVLDIAYAEGLRSFMCTTHDRIGEVCDAVRADPQKYEGFNFMPCMPYAHKYANAVTEEGMLGALRKFLPDGGFVDAAVRGGKSVVGKDIRGLTTLLVDAEMAMFRGLPTPVIFLQNVVVDLLLGLGMDDGFAIFADHVRDKYGAEPGFITMNLPALLDSLARVGVEDPIVCANMNKLGFRMSGGLAAYEEAMERHRCRAIAMSVLASGAIPAREAIEWIAERPRVEAFVFGASSQANIHQTVSLARELWVA
ncbi:MAG: hypothetical protein JSS97_06660 [Actinobacteria bacterium]|nr:hypothetical protein [Actinomycetota bacterium]